MGHVEVGRSLSPLLFRDKDERNRIWKERYESCNCEKQIFLKTGTSPKLKVGAWNHIKISSIGKHTTIWVGGVKVVDMDDPSYNSAKMSSGFIGLYTEDASVGFDNVYIGK